MQITPTAAPSKRKRWRLRVFAFWLVVLGLGALPWFAQAQSQDQARLQAQSRPQSQDQATQQLQDEIRRLEQLTQELKARIVVLEKKRAADEEDENGNTSPDHTSASGSTSAARTSSSAPMRPSDEAPVDAQVLPISLVRTSASVQSYPPGKNVDEKKPGMEIYGFTMLDMGYNFGQINPNWFDVVRPSQLPAFHNEFGENGSLFTGVRQTRFGVKANFPTPLGELKTIFEWELFGVGVDAGQTTFRLRHAWGELGQFGAGQTWSPFMDPDVFPNSLEYWGPNGMVFFRNVQVRWMPINKGNHQLWFAAERPGANGDQSAIASREELQNITARFPLPDISARFRWGGEREYVQVSGIARYIRWDDLTGNATLDFSGNTWGWGVNASTGIPSGKKNSLHLEATYGHGIENYMNDAPVDIAPIAVPTNLHRPINGEALPVLAFVAFQDLYWSERWSTSVGYSYLRVDNTALQLPSEFHKGQYGLINLLHYPTKNIMIGGEFQWGQRNNFTDGFQFDDYRIQASFRYNFDYKLGGEKAK